MPLSNGQKIGPYEIVAPLGAGGMGEVYRARDSKLKRDVALKVLPADVGGDDDRLARFQREAEVLASLNHPHIAQVYGVEDHALIMELVDGEDLSQRIRRGPVPLDEAIAIAKQIAMALEAAHDAGIVHRDLKPGNVKVREDGTVKVLDFGLARQGRGRDFGSGIDLSDRPTVVGPAMTMHGAILGTPGYMSPEQAKGKPVDKRADIWAFGCVLYEMLVGKATFTGATTGEVMAALINDEPDWTSLEHVAPPRIRRLIERCLDKDPRMRLRDIGDARLLFDGDDRDVPVVAAPPPRQRSTILPWAIAGSAVIAAAAIAIPSWRPAASPPPPLRFVEPVVADARGPSPVLAPDGSFLVYVTDGLKVRRLSDVETISLPGTDGATSPFVSPDSRWIGFYADGKLKRVAVGGREPAVITDVSADSAGAAFASSDRVIFSPTWYQSVLHSVPAEGGPVTPISTLNAAAGERGHWWPHVLPGGRQVLFTIWYAASGLSASRIGVLDLDTGTHRVLFPGAMAQYANGHVLYFHAGQHLAAPFDPASLAIGESTAVLPDALSLDPTGDTAIPVSVASTGAVAYWPGDRYPLQTFTWIDRSGRQSPTAVRSEAEGAELSPDDRFIAVGRPRAGESKIWIFNIDGGEQVLASKGSSWKPVWHPDGRRLAFTTMDKGEFDVATQSPDGPADIPLAGGSDEEIDDWLPDGRMIVREWTTSDAARFLLVDPNTKQRTPILAGDFETFDAQASPDARWLAVCAKPAGATGLYVQSIGERSGLQRLAAANDFCNVRWSAAARELAFLRGDALIALSYEERAGKLVPLRETVIATLPAGSELYGISRDGSRFMVGIPPTASTPVTGIRIIVDGIAALKR